MLRALCLLVLSTCAALPTRADDLTVLTPELAGGPPQQMLSRQLKRVAFEALEHRRTRYESIKTPEEFEAYRARLRAEFLEHLGTWPDRTPLEAQVVGTVEGDGFRVERVVFQSQPRHFVAAVLFLPTSGRAPHPVVVMPCGHSANGKIANQTAGMLLAKNGIACLSYDPIGQGERYQFLDAQGRPRFKPTTEHTIVGAGSIPVGRGAATYRIWDGLRTIDYAASRTDLDATRIGVSGCSGGGTLTSYLMALDERVACAAPSCYVTNFRRLLETLGPQDAEQNIHAQLAFGLDHADYLLLRAPKPTLILAATHDFFDIGGTWETYREAKRLYTRLGFGEQVALVETDTKHGYPRPQREAMVRWMRRWFTGKDEPVEEPMLAAIPSADLTCTPQGQVMRLAGARSVVDLNVEVAARLAPQRAALWKGDRGAALAEVRRLAGIRPLAQLPRTAPKSLGTLDRNGTSVEKLVFEPETGVFVPGLLYRPAKASGARRLIANGAGKESDAGPDGPIAKGLAAGETVLAVDVRGTGETGPTEPGQWGAGWNDFFVGYLVGRTLVGGRAEDLLIAARHLSELKIEGRSGPVALSATGSVGVPALHATVLEPQLFGSTEIAGSLTSWTDFVANPTAPGHLANTVHGALAAYDLPDLIAAAPKDQLRVRNPLDPRAK